MSDIPEWAVKRANDLTGDAMRDGSWLPIGGHASAAFARYIAERERPPVARPTSLRAAAVPVLFGLLMIILIALAGLEIAGTLP